MKKPALLIFLLLILFSEISYSQGTFFKNYDGIPIIANLWGMANNTSSIYDFNDIQEVGIDAVIATNITAQVYNRLKLKTKIIPYQATIDNRKGVAYYTERGYSLWEAENMMKII